MESDARYVWVGAMLIALFAAVAGGLYWLSGASDNLPTKRYTVYFRQQSLEGLQIGSEVRMRGIKVGRVADYDILPDAKRGVRVLLEVDERIPVLEGALAEINRKLVTGIAGVDIVNVRAGVAPITLVPTGEQYPVLAEGTPEITRMTGLLEDLGSNGGEALRRLNQLLSEDNQRALAGILANTRTLTGHMSTAAPQLQETLAQTQQAAARLEQVGVTADRVLSESGRNLDRLAHATQGTLESARVTLNHAGTALDQARGEIASLGLNLRLATDMASQELQTTSKVLRDSGRSLQQSTRALAEPERILFGPAQEHLGPGEE